MAPKCHFVLFVIVLFKLSPAPIQVIFGRWEINGTQLKFNSSNLQHCSKAP